MQIQLGNTLKGPKTTYLVDLIGKVQIIIWLDPLGIVGLCSVSQYFQWLEKY